MNVCGAAAWGPDLERTENRGPDFVVYAPPDDLMSFGGLLCLRLDGHLSHDLELGRGRRLCDSGIPHKARQEREEGRLLSHSLDATSLFSVKRDVARRWMRFFVGSTLCQGEEARTDSRIKSVLLPTVVPMLTNTFHPIRFR